MTGDDEGRSRVRAGRWLPAPAVHRARDTASGPAHPSRPETLRVEAEAPVGPLAQPQTAPVDPADAVRAGDAGDLHGSHAIEGGLTGPTGYLGRRREEVSARRRWLWVVTALAALCTVLVVATAMCSSPPPGGSGRRGEIVPGGGPAVTGAIGEPSSSIETSAGQGFASARPSARPAFKTIRLEAEAASAELGGTAQSVPYDGASGGTIVKSLGRQGPGAKKTGTLTFPDVTVPDNGTYTLTLFLVIDGDDASQTAVVGVASGGSLSVTVSGGATCCVRAVVAIKLTTGRNAVTIGNPDGRAPSVDRIVISAP